MKVIADDAIFACEELVQARLPEEMALVRLPGREIAKADLSECVALLTRTVTKVDASLLGRAPQLRVVASASAGFDHVDRVALDERGVHFANAPGCNALAVAQWVSAAWTELLELPQHAHRREAIMGVVGYGQVGSRTAACLRALGHEVLVCDPLKSRAGECPEHRPLEELLEACDALSLHVPLTRDGSDPTFELLGRAAAEAFLERGGTLINTSRGEVLELPEAIPDGSMLILDVWPH
jgi:erythronate-4-phosphate dehydrogenase